MYRIGYRRRRERIDAATAARRAAQHNQLTCSCFAVSAAHDARRFDCRLSLLVAATTTTRCARGDTMPRPSPPRVGADFVIDRFFMKLFKTNNTNTVRFYQIQFGC